MKTRNKQCQACPWRVDATDHESDIPNYDRELHKNLTVTIAEPASLRQMVEPNLRLMGCHEHQDPENQIVCVGWLANQLGPGNNLALRMAALQNPELGNFELVGEQHEKLEDTFGADQ